MNPSAIAGPSSEKRLQMTDIRELLVCSSESESDLSSDDEIEEEEEGRQEEIPGEGSSSEDEEEIGYYSFGSETWIPNGGPREAFSTFAEGELLVDFGEKPTALQIFEYFFDDELTKHITHQTNLFAEQSTREKRRSSLMKRRSRDQEWKETNTEEMKFFFGLIILQGILQKPTNSSFFCRHRILQTPFFFENMTENRFHLLRKFLHFNDNTLFVPTATNKRLFKLKPVFDYLIRKWQSAYTPGRNISIDESLLLWKGRLQWRVYIPKKRARYGMESFQLCESSTGYVHNMIMYTGSETELKNNVQGLDISNQLKSTKIVLSLMDQLLNKGYMLFVDNYYTSPVLFDLLVDFKTDAVGTLRKNRKELPEDIKKKKLKKGDFIAFYRKKLMTLKWQDKKEVCMLSTVHGAEVVPVQTRGGEEKLKPLVCVEYSKGMGRIDLADHCITTYSIARTRLKKYYQKMFRHLLDITIFNSFVLYKKCGGMLSQLNFRLQLVDQLTEKYLGGVTKPVASRKHMKEITPKRLLERHFLRGNSPTSTKRHATRKCIVCTKKGSRKESSYSCKQCGVPLCIEPCMEIYHTKENF
ncbi:piggyBac transposable element-derived protein 4-like [Centruroides vittatus]|uniref:piggyBac transposable element-derived protein 4-like n=1 Tax=Centruroides vittatus TaxID=120091 RepID=UPI00351081FE